MLNLFIIYYVIISLIVFGWILSHENDRNFKSLQLIFAVAFAIGTTYFIVFRPYTTIGDTLPYVEDVYPQVKTSSSYADYNTKSFEETERFFYYVTKFCTFMGGPRFYLFFLFLIFILTSTISISNIWGKESLLAFYAFISIFSFYALTMNIVRNSLAVGFWYLGISAYQRKNYILFTIFAIVSIQFHISSLMFWTIFLLAKYLKDIRIYALLFLAALALSIFNFDISELLSQAAEIGFSNELIQSKLIRYGNKVYDFDYTTGFRLDFILFNTGFLIFAGTLYLLKYKNSFYNHITRTYILLTIIFFLWFQIPGSDRVGLLSWMMIPFILCFPFADPNYKVPFGFRLVTFASIFFIGCFSIYISRHLFS